MSPITDAFISYAREDKALVERLYAALKARGREAWVDWDSIPPTADWMLEILGGIEAANTFIFVLSPDSLASQVCGEEVRHAVSQGKRLIPLVAREIPTDQVPPELAALNWIFVRPQDDFHAAVDRLVWALDTDLEHVRSHTRLLTRAREWDRQKRDPSFVLQGRDLQSAEFWLTQRGTQRDPLPTPLQSEYILASRAYATRRQRAALSGVTIGLVVALVLAVTAAHQWQAASASRRRAQAQAEVADRNGYGATMNLIQREWESHNVGRILELLEETRTSKARGWEWGYWNRRCHLDLLTLQGHTDKVSSVAFSPGGRRVVTGSEDGTAKLWDAASGRELLTLQGHTRGIFSAAFSPDGRRVVTGSEDGTAKLWDAASGRELLTLQGHADGVTSAAFSPDGRQVLTGSYDSTAKLWDAASGREGLTLEGHTRGGVLSAAFSPDGRRVVTWSNDKTAKLWDATSGREMITLKGHTEAVTSVAFSPDGRRVLTGSEDGTAKLWDAASGRELLTLQGHTNGVRSAAFSPDGRRVLTGSRDGTAKLWDSLDPAPGPLAGASR